MKQAPGCRLTCCAASRMVEWRTLLLAALAVVAVAGAREPAGQAQAEADFLALAPAPAPAGVAHGRAYGWEDADWELPEKVYSLYKAVKYLAYEEREQNKELKDLEATVKLENATLTTNVVAQNVTLNAVVKEIDTIKVGVLQFAGILQQVPQRAWPSTNLCHHVRRVWGASPAHQVLQVRSFPPPSSDADPLAA